jgi:hypothetical protein
MTTVVLDSHGHVVHTEDNSDLLPDLMSVVFALAVERTGFTPIITWDSSGWRAAFQIAPRGATAVTDTLASLPAYPTEIEALRALLTRPRVVTVPDPIYDPESAPSPALWPPEDA